MLSKKFNGIWPFDPTQGYQFDPWVKISHVSFSIDHPLQFDMPHDHVPKKFNFWPPAPPSPTTPGAWPWRPNEYLLWPVYNISFMCEKTYTVWFKNLWNWLCNWNLTIFDLLAPPQGAGQKKVPLHTPFIWVTHTPNLVGFRLMV